MSFSSDKYALDRSLIIHLAESARLELTEDELERYTEQLKVILDAFKDLDKVDTENVRPSFHPVETKNKLRDDKTEDWSWDPLENTVHREGKSFRGPKIT